MSPPPLVAVGALNADLVFRLAGPVAERASNVATLERRPGGVAANVARAFAHEAPKGPAPLLVTAAGDDPPPPCDGVEVLSVHRPGPSPTYAAVLGADGELHLGLAATGLVETLTAQDVRTCLGHREPSALVLDANLSRDCLTELSDASATVVAMAVSPEKALRLAPIAARVDALFCNRREAAALTGRADTAPLDALADALREAGWRRVVLTDGPDPLVVSDDDGRTRLRVARATGAVNGAGDALAGATLVHWLAGAPLARAVADAGLPAATRHLAAPR